MNKSMIYTVLVIVLGAALATWMLLVPPHSHDNESHGHHDSGHEEEVEKGPNGGRLLRQDNFSLELTLYERGVPPEFHVYAYSDNQPINPEEIELVISLSRLDGQVDSFKFSPQGEYLRSDGVVTEPHSFVVDVAARHDDADYTWHYDNFEGRVQIAAELAEASGIKVEMAGEQMLRESLNLTGRVQADPNRLAQVRARFPGVVSRINREVGDRVEQGDVLAKIQSNESLQHYNVKAPIGGVIVSRNLQVGAATGDAPMFVIADVSSLWIELDVFDQDLSRVAVGHVVEVATLNGGSVTGAIDWLSPMVAHTSQSAIARVVVANTDEQLRPGQFVGGTVTIAEYPVPMAVRKSAIQQFRDFQVVFARLNETYEVRMLALGRSDDHWVEVLDGLKPGAEYVTENSYVIKADIEKSGASHDH